MYTIKPYTLRMAKKLGVSVKPSTNKTKKIDVFDKNNKKIASVGALGMNDYPTYIMTRGKKYALSRRKLYKIRHQNDRTTPNTPGYFADKLLW